MNNDIRIGLINWYTNRHWFGNVVRNLLLPLWLDWETRTIDFNLNSTPTLDLYVFINLLSVNRDKMHVLPTLTFPSTIKLNSNVL